MGPPKPPAASPSLCPTPPHSDQASPSCSCCPIVCRHGERHRLPHHAGERPGAGGRGGGLSPAVGGAQPDLDLLLGVSEGRRPSPWHWGEGQRCTAPISSLLWRSPSPRMNKEESLLLPQLLPHSSSLPSQGGCNYRPAQKQPPPCLLLCSRGDSQALTDPSVAEPGFPACSPAATRHGSFPTAAHPGFSAAFPVAAWKKAISVTRALRLAGKPPCRRACARSRACRRPRCLMVPATESAHAGGGDGSTRCASLWQRWWGRRGTKQPC